MSDRANESLIQPASKVLENAPAESSIANSHFRSKLSFETDPSDLYHDITNKVSRILVIDARTPEAHARGHVPGSINMPHRTIDYSTTGSLPRDKDLVTYCDGVFRNVSTTPSAKMMALGFRVKETLDGMEGWRKEGYPIEA